MSLDALKSGLDYFTDMRALAAQPGVSLQPVMRSVDALLSSRISAHLQQLAQEAAAAPSPRSLQDRGSPSPTPSAISEESIPFYPEVYSDLEVLIEECNALCDNPDATDEELEAMQDKILQIHDDMLSFLDNTGDDVFIPLEARHYELNGQLNAAQTRLNQKIEEKTDQFSSQVKKDIVEKYREAQRAVFTNDTPENRADLESARSLIYDAYRDLFDSSDEAEFDACEYGYVALTCNEPALFAYNDILSEARQFFTDNPELTEDNLAEANTLLDEVEAAKRGAKAARSKVAHQEVYEVLEARYARLDPLFQKGIETTFADDVQVDIAGIEEMLDRDPSEENLKAALKQIRITSQKLNGHMENTTQFFLLGSSHNRLTKKFNEVYEGLKTQLLDLHGQATARLADPHEDFRLAFSFDDYQRAAEKAKGEIEQAQQEAQVAAYDTMLEAVGTSQFDVVKAQYKKLNREAQQNLQSKISAQFGVPYTEQDTLEVLFGKRFTNRTSSFIQAITAAAKRPII